MRNKKIALLALIVTVPLLLRCGGNTSPEKKPEPGKMESAGPAAEAVKNAAITPRPLPDPNIKNFHFPESESTIDEWLNKNDNGKIYAHGWGIWTALNMPSGEHLDGQELTILETWATKGDIKAASAGSKSNAFAVNGKKNSRGELEVPQQFLHRNRKAGNKALLNTQEESHVLSFVKFDPSSTDFLIKNKLMNAATLQDMLQKGVDNIPNFPNTAIITKNVYKTISQADLAKNNGYYKLPVWPGPPSPAKAFGEDAWNTYVYIDMNNKSNGDGGVDAGGGRNAHNTYNLSDFIFFKLDAATSKSLNDNFKLATSAGDVAILVGMHVTSREITRWTWQSFWWAPNANTPPLPSSAAIASARPAELKGAPRHYGMAIGYTFIEPNMPLTGGKSVGKSLYAYNPYLEAGFDPGVLTDTAIVKTNGKLVYNEYGVNTNCMSCHANANVAPGSLPNPPGYIGDTYIDLKGPQFKKVLRTDFSWAVADAQ